MKILYVTTISSTMVFFVEHIKMLQAQGHIIELACNMEKPLPENIASLECKVHNIPFSRSPLSRDNFKGYKEIKKLLNEEKYDVVHTHTPNASVLVRLAAKKLRKSGLKVMYTAHGFHFYKGAPLKNWLIYYPVEKMCAHWTDALITINREDYALAQKKMKAKKIYYVPGVGIDTERFRDTVVDKKAKRAELGVPQDAVLLLSVGELNENKNHETVIKALAQIKRKDVHYAIAGQGELENYLKKVATNFDVDKQVHLVGYRTDVAELYKAADICCFPSIREGLGLAALEGMAAGLPLIASDNRGTRDYAVNGINGFICRPNDICAFANAIDILSEDEQLCRTMSAENRSAAERYNNAQVLPIMGRLYACVEVNDEYNGEPNS